MQRILPVLILIIAICNTGWAQNLRWIDATELGIHGYAQKSDKSPYYRYDHTPYTGLNKTVVSHSKKCTGLYLSFKTTSTQISATWENVPSRMGDNMAGIAQKGLDLYINVDGEWKFAAVGRVSTLPEKSRRTKPLIQNMPEGEKEFLLYLPVWCELLELKLGIDSNATIEGLPSPFRHKVIVHGSSITHGAAASRAGLTYPAQLSRNLGIDFVNFGFSGECRMQPQFLEFLKSCEADAFLFDAFSNPSAEEIAERLNGFVEGLVKAHPGKPLIFLQSPINQTLDTKMQSEWNARIEISRNMMKALTKRYKDVYYLEVMNVVGENGMVDGTHPTDLGFHRLVDAYQPKIAKILKRYDIK